jgi:hypothetical protein
MTDPKEALERLEAACAVHEMEEALGLNCIVAKADLRTIIAEREGLERRIAAMEQVTVGPLSYTAMRCRAEAAEAKLSALTAAARPFAELAQREDDAMNEMGLNASPDDMLVYDIDQTLTLGQCRRLRALLPSVPVENNN